MSTLQASFLRRWGTRSKSIALAASCLLPMSSLCAQNVAPTKEILEEIIVTGVRASLANAQEAKRSASVIAEFVTQEDVGKYTDQNLAETLQRVPGVQISRAQSGEGTFVSIRGLGPSFVLSTINGRSAFGGAGGDDGLGNRNAFSLDAIAPEQTAGVEVFKSVRADMQEGGIGGTVNILTARPLDLAVDEMLYQQGLYLSMSFDGTYAAEPEEIDPRVSGLASWKSADDTFGVLFSASYYDRTTLTQISRIITTDFDDTIAGVPNVFRPASDSEYAMNDGTIERLGLGLTAQWRPSDELEVIFDAHSSDQLSERHQNTLRMRLPGDIAPLIQNPDILRVNSPGVGGVLLGGIIPVTNQPGVDQPFSSIAPDYTQFDREERSYGAHVTWKPTAPLTVDFDAAYFESEFDRDEDIAAYEVLGIYGFNYRADRGTGLPIFSFLPDPASGAPFNVNDLQLGAPVDFGFNRINAGGDETAFRLDLDWQVEWGAIESVEFGLNHRTRKQDQVFNVLRYGLADLNNMLTAAGIDPATTPNFAVTARRSIPGASGGFLSEVSGMPYDTWFALDAREVFAFYRPAIDQFLAARGVNLDDRRADPNLGLQFGPFGGNGFFEGREEIAAAYLMANFDSTLFGVPFTANLGVRGVDTSTRGQGLRTSTAIDPATGNTIARDANGNPIVSAERVADEGESFELLPSGNISFSLRPSLYLRLAASKVVTPPDLSFVAGASSVGFDTSDGETITAININVRNPDLDPFEANQYDATLEWYPEGSQALIAVGYFYKDIKSLITTETLFPESFILDGVTYSAQEDVQLRVSRPTNGDGGAIVSGLEFQTHLPFNWFSSNGSRWFDDFGLQATYTYILKNETAIRDPQTREQLPFEGASEDNYSVVGYYDNSRFSSRVSYTYRSRAFAGQGFGGGLFNESYGSLDANVDYRLNDNLSLRLQVANITEEPFRQSIVGGRSPYLYSQNGRLFILGARMQF